MKGGTDYTTSPPRPVPLMRCPLCAEPLAEHEWWANPQTEHMRGHVIFACAPQNDAGPPSGEGRAG